VSVEDRSGTVVEDQAVSDDLATAKECLDRINESVERLKRLSRVDAVDALAAQLIAIDLHRDIALDLIRAIRPPGVFQKTLLGIDPIDLLVIVFLDGQTAPVSQNTIVREIRERYSIGRAGCAALIRRLERKGAIKRTKKGNGRGGGIRWVLVGEKAIDAAVALRAARRTDTELV